VSFKAAPDWWGMDLVRQGNVPLWFVRIAYFRQRRSGGLLRCRWADNGAEDGLGEDCVGAGGEASRKDVSCLQGRSYVCSARLVSLYRGPDGVFHEFAVLTLISSVYSCGPAILSLDSVRAVSLLRYSCSITSCLCLEPAAVRAFISGLVLSQPGLVMAVALGIALGPDPSSCRAFRWRESRGAACGGGREVVEVGGGLPVWSGSTWRLCCCRWVYWEERALPGLFASRCSCVYVFCVSVACLRFSLPNLNGV